MPTSRPLYVHTYTQQVRQHAFGPRLSCGSTADGGSSSQVGVLASQVATSHTHPHTVAAVFAHAVWVTPEMAHTVSQYAMAMATPVPSAMDAQTDIAQENVDLVQYAEKETLTDGQAAETTLDASAPVRRCNARECHSRKRG